MGLLLSFKKLNKCLYFVLPDMMDRTRIDSKIIDVTFF